MKKKILIAILSLLAISGFVTKIVLAQQPLPNRFDLTVSPPLFELNANPGDTIKERFRVRNNNTDPTDIQLSVSKLVSDPDSGGPIPDNATTGEELSWVTFDPSSFTAPPKEWTDVNYTITIPKNAAFGYYYVIRIAPKDKIVQKTTGAKVNGELLVIILLNVKSDKALIKGELLNFTPKQFVNQYLPVDFNVKITNKGNVHMKPRGNIFIRSFNQKDIAVLDVNQNQGAILPGGIRVFDSSWSDGFLVNEPVMQDGQIQTNKDGSPITHLVINWNKLTSFRVGPYTASLFMVYDDGHKDQTIEGTTTFWVIPYIPLAIILVGIIVIIVVVRFMIKSYISKELAKAKKS